MFRPLSSPLISHLQGMYESERYNNNATWHNATETLKVPAASVLAAAEYHFNTRRDLLGDLEGIQQRMEEVDHAVEAALRMRDEHEWQTESDKLGPGEAGPKKRQEEARQAAILQDALARQIANAGYQLSVAESELGRLLSNAASARERDGTAVKKAKDQLAAALASTDNIAEKGDYGIGLVANRLSRLAGVTFIKWLGFSRVPEKAPPQMKADAANEHVEHARSAGRELLESLKRWGTMSQFTKDEWNRIDSRRQEPSRNSEPAHVRLAIAGLLRFLQEYQITLAQEIEIFMKTWGPGAGYVWEQVEQATRVTRACRPEAQS